MPNFCYNLRYSIHFLPTRSSLCHQKYFNQKFLISGKIFPYCFKIRNWKSYLFTSEFCLPFYYNEKTNTKSYIYDVIRGILGFNHSLADKKLLLWAYCLTTGDEIAAYNFFNANTVQVYCNPNEVSIPDVDRWCLRNKMNGKKKKNKKNHHKTNKPKPNKKPNKTQNKQKQTKEKQTNKTHKKPHSKNSPPQKKPTIIKFFNSILICDKNR